MKAIDIINRLAVFLPKHTDKLTTNVAVSSLTRSGTTVTVNTSAAHGLSIGQQANIIGAQTPLTIATLTRAGIVGTLVTDNDHDLTENDYLRADVEISGATEAEFNGTFTILTVPNRKTVTFTMADSGATTATGTPLLLNGSSVLQSYNGLKNVATVPTTTSFTYEITDLGQYSPASGTISVRTQPRISGGISVERIIDAYTQQTQDQWWIFVVLDDVIASKSRHIDTDATDNLQKGTEFRQQIIQPFSLLAVGPAKSEIAGRSIRDDAEDLFRPILQSILFSKIDSGLFVQDQNPIQFVDHGFAAYNGAFYAHLFNFQATADITFDDTVGYDDDVAFRDIVSNLTIDLGTREDALTANIDLDDVLLP